MAAELLTNLAVNPNAQGPATPPATITGWTPRAQNNDDFQEVADPLDGLPSFRIIRDTDAAGFQSCYMTTAAAASPVPVAGQWIAVACDMRTASVVRNGQITVIGNVNGQIGFGASVPLTTDWQRLTALVQEPDNDDASVTIRINVAANEGEVFYVRKVSFYLITGSQVDAQKAIDAGYFDGSSEGARWLGTPHNSRSTRWSTYPLAVAVEHGLTYTILGPDGTRAVINDSSDPDFVGFIDADNGGVTGLERAGVRENADVLPEADGGVHGAFLYDRLGFALNLLIPDGVGGLSWRARQAKLKRATDAMREDALLQWTPTEAIPVEVSFRQQQPLRITDKRPKRALLVGVCEDPVVVSQDENVLTLLAAGVLVGGMASPLKSPLASGQAPAGQLIVTNDGAADAWPVLRLDGPMTNPVITFLESGANIPLTYNLAAGDFLEIDTNPRRRSILLNGAVNRYSALRFDESLWAPLLPGDNTVRLGLDAYAAPASLEVTWRDTW